MNEYNALNFRTTGCARCNNPAIEPGYTIRLCKSCRRLLSRYPVKKQVLLAALGVGVILLLSMFRLPTYFNTGVDYMRGLRLAKERKYVSADKYFTATLKKFPEHIGSTVHLLTAVYFNDNMPKFDSIVALQVIAQVPPDDEALTDELAVLVKNALHYTHIQDTTVSKQLASLIGDTSAYLNELQHYTNIAPDDIAAMMLLAETDYKLGNYPAGDSLCKKVILHAPLFRPAYYAMLNSLQEQHKYQEGLNLSLELLEQNKESPKALLLLSLFQLQLKKDKETLAAIRQATQVAPDLQTKNPSGIKLL